MMITKPNLLLLILLTAVIACQNQKVEQHDFTDRWKITLNSNSMETILLRPEMVIANPDSFWENDEAYVLAANWHNSTGISKDYKNYYGNWLAFLNAQAALTEEERRQDEAFRIVEAVQERKALFAEKSVPLLNEFSPKNDLKFEFAVNLTTKTLPFAFMTNGQVVADPLSSYFKGDPDMLWNSITHECFHIAYGYNRHYRTEIELENGFIYNTILDGLHNEGMATYLGYQALTFFPSEEIPDYQMLEDPESVTRHLTAVNGLLEMAVNAEVDSIRSVAWDIGVMDRGYYVLGAHMSQVIDEKLGREALVATMTTGPLGFVEVYNSLVSEDRRVCQFEKPDKESLFAQLKLAAFQRDNQSLRRLTKWIQAADQDLSSLTAERLTRLGYAMMQQKAYDWAIQIFEFGIQLYPATANSYDCLAEAYLESGDRNKAIAYYQEALEVDPNFQHAKKMLKDLTGSV